MRVQLENRAACGPVVIPQKVALAYAIINNSRWRNRSEFINGRIDIIAFLSRKWAKELDYRLIKEQGIRYMNGLAPLVRQLPALLQGPECETVFSQMEAYLGTVYRPKLILDLSRLRKLTGDGIAGLRQFIAAAAKSDGESEARGRVARNPTCARADPNQENR